MFGSTPRLDVNAVSDNLWSHPAGSMRLIKVWLDGYIEVTATKDYTGDRCYREQCMLWAEQLSTVITAMIIPSEQSFSQLPSQQKGLITRFIDLIEQFLSSNDIPKKQRSKAGKLWQGVLCALDFIPEVQEYESIHFLEDLEALAMVFKKRFFLYESFILQYKDQAVELSFSKLQESPVFSPSLEKYLIPLMLIALEISPAHIERLQKLHITIPEKITFAEDVFESVFEVLEALSQDLNDPDENVPYFHIQKLFQRWNEEKKDLTEFFVGMFGSERDNVLLDLKNRFLDPIGCKLAASFLARKKLSSSSSIMSDVLTECGIGVSSTVPTTASRASSTAQSPFFTFLEPVAEAQLVALTSAYRQE